MPTLYSAAAAAVPSRSQRHPVSPWLYGLLPLLGLACLLWSSDQITLQGQRTVYTVECEGGSWTGSRCTGRLVAGERYQFQAVKAYREVLVWRAGARQLVGKLESCNIVDGRNWDCKSGSVAGQTITLRLARGRPVPDPTHKTLPFHAVEKWRWFLLRWGLPAGDDALE